MTRLETLSNGTPCYVTGAFGFGRDALLLARFAMERGVGSTLELCSGCGIVALEMYDLGHREQVYSVELHLEGSCLLMRSAGEAGAGNIHAINSDIRSYSCRSKLDAAVCNPPFFTSGSGPAAQGPRGDARSDRSCTLGDMCAAAARNLKQGGKLIFCIPPARLQAAFLALSEAGFEAKAMKLVRRDPGAAPRLALIDARYQGGEGLELLPDLIERQPE